MEISPEIRNKTREVLMDLIAIPSTRGNEGPAARYLYEKMAPLVDVCQLVEIDDAIVDDPDYAFPLPGFTYEGTPNLECVIRGASGGRKVIFNAHLDVVPGSEDQIDPFVPREENGVIFGRGACDDKGGAAALYGLALLLHSKGLRPAGDLIFHLVIEEEPGGNGTLALVRRGVEADAVVVAEPTAFAIAPAVRGAVWFQLKVFGRAGHSGSQGPRISALDKAYQAMQILRDYHDRLLAESRGLPLFDAFEDPMPITFGQLTAGNWPSIIPAKAELKGVLGLLPNRTHRQVQAEMREALATHGDEWLRDHFELTFPMLHSDGNMIPADHPLVTSLQAAIQRHGLPGEVRAMTAACDAWFYNNMAGIPTVVMGPGGIGNAHSKDEQIAVDDVLTASSILVDFVQDFCERGDE